MKRARVIIVGWTSFAVAAFAAGCGETAKHEAASLPVPELGAPDAVAHDVAAAPQRSRRRTTPRFLIARVHPGRTLALRSRPRGRVIAHVGSLTVFGNPTRLGVVAVRHGWLGVTAPQLPNHRVGWFRPHGNVTLGATRTWLRVDVSKRRLELLKGKRVVARAPVAIGRPGSPTPRGRFAVTDLLSGPRFNAAYGPFILALSGRQTKTPVGWSGGNRLAIHGTNNPTEVGRQASAGCVVTTNPVIARIVKRVRPGAPVVIES